MTQIDADKVPNLRSSASSAGNFCLTRYSCVGPGEGGAVAGLRRGSQHRVVYQPRGSHESGYGQQDLP